MDHARTSGKSTAAKFKIALEGLSNGLLQAHLTLVQAVGLERGRRPGNPWPEVPLFRDQ